MIEGDVSLHHIWDEHLWGPWTESKLLSRKWLTVVVFALTAIGLDVAGRALLDSTINAVRDVVVAFVGVQGAIDFFKYRTMNKATKKREEQ